MFRKFFTIFTLFIIGINSANAETIVHENFDDRNYEAPLTFYNVSGYDQNLEWDSSNGIGGNGYCLRWDHTNAMAGVGVLQNFADHAAAGIYIRYWVKYDRNYLFPNELGDFDNLKLFKVASGGGLTDYDVEFIYKNTDGGPSNLQLFWKATDGSTAGTGTGNTTLGGTLTKGTWHKIEIYIRISSTSVVHVQIDDFDVYNNRNANIRLPASAYTGSQQFQSIRAGSRTPSGQGYWFTDNVTIVANEGDLCNAEPAEPAETNEPTSPGTTDNSPVILINTPTQSASYTTSNNSVTIEGNASDDNGLASISWNTSDNQQGVISSDLNNWSTGAIQLQEGTTQVTVTATDTNGQTSSDTLSVTYTALSNTGDAGTSDATETTQIWDANTQTGDSTWSNSTATWCVRALVDGASIAQSGDIIKIGFMGRSSSDYQIRKVSIAEVDSAGGQGAVVDNTWTRVTFDKTSVSYWGSRNVTIPAGSEKLSDPVGFTIDSSKDYYITYTMVSPSVYLVAPSTYQQLYFEGEDHADELDWTNNGFSTYSSRLHALSSIYFTPNEILPPNLHSPN